MHVSWFKNEEHLVYINGETELPALEKALKFPGLTAAAAQLRDHPTAEGLTVKGPKRTSARLFVPDLVFDEHIEMGENIFFYMDKCEALSTKPEECRYSFMQHTACEFFPCHKTAHPEDFNCLFCYCPLYTLGDQCGGNFAYIGDGIKDCSNCLLPHGRGSYSYVTGKFGELAELAKKNRKQQ